MHQALKLGPDSLVAWSWGIRNNSSGKQRRAITPTSWTQQATLQHSVILRMEHDTKNNLLNLPGNINYVCMTLTRTAYMTEGQFWHTDVTLVIWLPFHLQNVKLHGAAAEGLHSRGRDGITMVTVSPVPCLSEKNLKLICLLRHANLDRPFYQVVF